MEQQAVVLHTVRYTYSAQYSVLTHSVRWSNPRDNMPGVTLQARCVLVECYIQAMNYSNCSSLAVLFAWTAKFFPPPINFAIEAFQYSIHTSLF